MPNCYSRVTRRNILTCLVTPLLAAPLLATGGGQENIGTSCADCPNYSGAFSIENQTGATIRYQYRWGDQHQWKPMVLNSGRVETHSYPLGEDRNARVPTPYIRFDCVGGDGRVTPKEYKIPFYAVGYSGFGPAVNKTQPKKFYFRYNGRNLDLLAR